MQAALAFARAVFSGDALLFSGAAVDFASDEPSFAPVPALTEAGKTLRARTKTHPKKNRIRSSIKIWTLGRPEANVETPDWAKCPDMR